MRVPPATVVLTTVLLGPAMLVGCSPDPPSHDKAVAVIAELCTDKTVAMATIGLPTDVFALSEVARQAFEMASGGISELDSEGLPAMDDDAPIQRYLRGAIAMNNALAELSREASFEEVAGMDGALAAADAAGTELDGAATELGLGSACGGAAWRGRVLDDARTVIGIERELMTPTGNYVVDVSTACTRYDRRVGLAPEGDSFDGARRRALVIRHATQQFGQRLGVLTPTPELAEAHVALIAELADVTSALQPSETLAIDEEEQELLELAARADEKLDVIDGQLARIGADC